MGLKTTERHIGQIAAEASAASIEAGGKKIGKARVNRAIYLQGLAKDGRTVGDAARLTKLAASTVKRYARIFDYNFADYAPRAVEAKEGSKRKRPPRIKLNTGDSE